MTSSASITNVNESGQEVFGYAPGGALRTSISSTCTATEASHTGSTTVTNGILQLSDDDPTNTILDHPPVTVVVQTDPAPNTEYVATST